MIDRLIPQRVTRAGLNLSNDTTTSEDDQFAFRNSGRAILKVVNGASDVVLTFAISRNVAGEDVEDRVVTVAANNTRYIGLFPPSLFNDPNGDVTFTLDDAANVELAVIEAS